MGGKNISKDDCLSPTWKSIVNIHLNAVVDNNSVTARNEIIRMAICADMSHDAYKELNELQINYSNLLEKIANIQKELDNCKADLLEYKTL